MEVAGSSENPKHFLRNIDNLIHRKDKDMNTHLLAKLTFIRVALAVSIGLASTAYSAVPPMEVTVFNGRGQVAFKTAVRANATFATPGLQPGRYVVQFNTKSAAGINSQYLIVVSAGKRKVIAEAVRGEKFTGGGAAIQIQVAPGSKITGQIADDQVVGDARSKYRVVDGKRFVWVTAELGSNRGGHWQEEGLASAANVVVWRSEDLQKRLDRGGEGSMITYSDHYPYIIGSKGY
jgi:hypothetical protein